MSRFEPTPEQSDILDAARTGGSVVVNAYAGTGKTTTLRAIAETTPAPKRLRYLAYNKATKVDAAASFPSNTAVTTTHGMAWHAVRQSRFSHVLNKLGGAYISYSQTARDLGIKQIRVGSTTVSTATLAVAAESIVKKFCTTSDLEISEGHYEPRSNYSREVNDAVCQAAVQYARLAWQDLIGSDSKSLRFTHDHYLKLWASGIISDGNIPRIPNTNDGDILLYDEAQDANPLMAKVVAAQEHMQLVYVGDENQAINRFNGSVNALRTFKAQHRLPLTQSWRFGQYAADAANVFLESLASPGRVRGNPGRTTHITDAVAAEAILCRTNMTAIAEVMGALDEGHKVALVGGTAEAKRFVSAADNMKKGIPNTHPELSSFSSWLELVEYVDQADNPGTLGTFVKVVDKHSIRKLGSALKRCVDENSGDADVFVSTAHKSKGREWGRVRLGTDFDVDLTRTNPNARDEDTLVRRDGQMLAYVAVTRGMESVNVGNVYENATHRKPQITAPGTGQTGVPTRGATHTAPVTIDSHAHEFIAAMPAATRDGVQGLLATTGVDGATFLLNAAQLYVDMHKWGEPIDGAA